MANRVEGIQGGSWPLQVVALTDTRCQAWCRWFHFYINDKDTLLYFHYCLLSFQLLVSAKLYSLYFEINQFVCLLSVH